MDTQSSNSNLTESEYRMEEYKAKWDYYKETLVNRKNLLDWYFKIVTIPASAFGIANIWAQSTKSIDVSEITNYRYIFFLIAVCGIGLFICYAIETGISQAYVGRIRYIEKTLMNVEYKDINPNLIINKYFGFLFSVGFWRASPKIFINTFLVILFITMPSQIATYLAILIGFISIFGHIVLYNFFYNIGIKKNNILVGENKTTANIGIANSGA
jgi:hypothetical protein